MNQIYIELEVQYAHSKQKCKYLKFHAFKYLMPNSIQIITFT